MQVLSNALICAAHEVLIQCQKGADVHVNSIAAILDAAIHSIPPPLVEDLMFCDNTAPVVRQWRKAMSCDLFTPKIRALFAELKRHLAPAEAALRQVPSTLIAIY